VRKTENKTEQECAADSYCVTRAVNPEEMDAAVQKSLIRDAKQYLKSKGRAIPVGMAMQDGPTESIPPSEAGLVGTEVVAQYYACGANDERADYIGINSYRYVPGGPMDAYDGLARAVKTFPVPAFLAESGALGTNARDWLIVDCCCPKITKSSPSCRRPIRTPTPRSRPPRPTLVRSSGFLTSPTMPSAPWRSDRSARERRCAIMLYGATPAICPSKISGLGLHAGGATLSLQCA